MGNSAALLKFLWLGYPVSTSEPAQGAVSFEFGMPGRNPTGEVPTSTSPLLSLAATLRVYPGFETCPGMKTLWEKERASAPFCGPRMPEPQLYPLYALPT